MEDAEAAEILEKVRMECVALPAAVERASHGQPTWFVQDKKSFVMFTHNHHNDGRTALWLAAQFGVQQSLADEAPEWYFHPPYVGARGWIGIRVDRGLDWNLVHEFIVEAYLSVAPAKLRAQYESDIHA